MDVTTVESCVSTNEIDSMLWDGVSLENGIKRCAFDATRVLKNYYSDVGKATMETYDTLESMCGSAKYDIDVLIEEIYFAWGKTLAATADDPVEAAARWAESQKLPALDALPPIRRIQDSAGKTLLLCRYLSCNGHRVFWISCRDLAKELGCDRDRAAGILRVLREAGYLTLVEEATKTKATRYRLNTDRDTERERGRGRPGLRTPLKANTWRTIT